MSKTKDEKNCYNLTLHLKDDNNRLQLIKATKNWNKELSIRVMLGV